MTKKIINAITIIIFIGFLLLGLVRTAFFPKPVNEYENRPANTLPGPTGFFDGTFTDGVEKALSDQIPLSETYKKTYNAVKSTALRVATAPFKSAMRGKYIDFGLIKLFDGDYFCQLPYSFDDDNFKIKPQMDARIQNINSIVAAHPEIEFYGYYVEKDIDINLETGARFDGFDYLSKNLNLKNFSKFSVDSPETYKKYFYKTDHHWNKDGSYKAYTELCSFLGITEPLLTPSSETKLTDKFSGAYAKSKGISGYYEPLIVSNFDYKPESIQIDGKKVETYGKSDTDFTYGGWYGLDKAETVFLSDSPEKENILILGDSYDNAVIELLSAHYNKLCAVDLRYTKDFELSSYLEKHDIDKVLFIGCANAYFEKEFNVEDKNI